MSGSSGVVLRGFGYRPAGSGRWAVRGVDLSIAPGERVLLLGASGAGKSTVLRAMAGLLDSGGEMVGQVTVDGLVPPLAGGRVGLLLQDPDAGLVLSRAAEDVAFGPQNAGRGPDEVARAVAAALSAVGFPYPDQHPISALSGGERQRLALAGVLALGPSLLLLDEPTSMLDPPGAALVRQAVVDACERSGRTVVVVEHDVEPWLDVVDRVVVLGPEGVEASGPVDEVARSAAAASTWLGAPATGARRSGIAGPELLRADQAQFCHRGWDRPALSPVDVELRSASTVALVGPNGSGKTTLARLLGGLAAPTRGAVTATADLLAGGGLPRQPHRWRAPALAGRIGSVFQNPEHAFLAGSVREELMIGPRAVGRPAAACEALADELMQRLRLDHAAGQNPFTLSGGEQRRLSVAAAIATSPRVLVLDEPTFGQDPATWREIAELTATLAAQGAAVAVATHDRRFRVSVADRVVELQPPGGAP